MKNVSIIFPHQLFKEHPIHNDKGDIYLVEEFLFFKQYNFHKTKIAFHRASMKFYADFLTENGLNVKYIDSHSKLSDIRNLIDFFAEENVEQITFIDPVDEWLQNRIQSKAHQNNVALNCLDTQLFLNSKQDLASFFKPDKSKFYHATFYKQQRQSKQILLVNDKDPLGGKWSFDSENRKKYPAKKTPPNINYPNQDQYWEEAKIYTQTYYANNLGEITSTSLYPYTFESADDWLHDFLENRFYAFGDYEDAIHKDNSTLHHSVLSPLMNVGLISPKNIVDRTLAYAKENNTNLNCTEGFIRQVTGWREFIRGMYICKGNYSRTQNFWNFKRKIPKTFYTGETGIPPVDTAIKSVLKDGYCHHIERLMVLGNFMLLCEFDPNEVYQWFMELFIDAYDWVMVPNVYGMSQFADGGLFATKPYISSSNYILKMSNHKRGDWQQTWDGLFWHFMDKQRNFFNANPRLNMLLRNFDKMEASKKEAHLKNAQKFFDQLQD
ncbi:cryptochrome/photolyase family protein [Wenyingzhuangia sp. IMCC45533]